MEKLNLVKNKTNKIVTKLIHSAPLMLLKMLLQLKKTC